LPNDLDHLHQAIQHTGLTSDINAPLSVSSRLAQTIYHTLQENHPTIAKKLVQDLHARTDPDACDLLLQGRGFTYFHVIQYFYAFIAEHTQRPNPLSFPVEVGRLGGGLYINPETDVLSLIQLLGRLLGNPAFSFGAPKHPTKFLPKYKPFTTPYTDATSNIFRNASRHLKRGCKNSKAVTTTS
jgi:hypothetical protein